jgi:hypothetical protein
VSLRHHLQYAIANAQVRTWPFPHIFVREIFPPNFYAWLERVFDTAPMTRFVDQGRVNAAYPKTRDVWPLAHGKGDLWDELYDAILGDDAGFTSTLLNVTFAKWYRRRFTTEHGKAGPFFERPTLTHEVLVTRDHDTFALGPHSDSSAKVATALFYVPKMNYVYGEHSQSNKPLGTSLYVPKDPTFRCPGGFHHARKDFDLVHTAPYVPNSMLAFFKTDNSFHGVEPVESAEPRRLLIYDVRVAKRVGGP